MSRRDTILVAVLINSGLLLILFITAMTNEASEPYPLVVEQGTVKEALEKEEDIEEIVKETSKTSEQLIEEEVPTKEEIPSQPNSEDFVFVTVKRGDFLEKIAKANASSVEEIMKSNDLDSTQLQIGQVLKIPLARKNREPEQEKAPEHDYYTVKQGDNPWLIAMKHRIKLDDLLKLNELDERSAKRLNPGDKIRIR